VRCVLEQDVSAAPLLMLLAPLLRSNASSGAWCIGHIASHRPSASSIHPPRHDMFSEAQVWFTAGRQPAQEGWCDCIGI
jgi:hypothetical protein